jgi:hypothetical protein
MSKKNKTTKRVPPQPCEITIFARGGGTLSKNIKLAKDNTLVITPAAEMARGQARRMPVADAGELAQVIRQLKPNEAITLGRLRADLPTKVEVTTKHKLNGAAGVIARDREHLVYVEGRGAFVLFDYDTKAKPAKIVVKDFWATLLKILPGLRNAARVFRASTSSGLFRTDTGEDMPGSDGIHIYIQAKDGNDAERFLTALFERCWLAKFGWIMIAADGRMLERSIIDRTVWASERFAFEAVPTLRKPLAQPAHRRGPKKPQAKCPLSLGGRVLETRPARSTGKRRERYAARRDAARYQPATAQCNRREAVGNNTPSRRGRPDARHVPTEAGMSKPIAPRPTPATKTPASQVMPGDIGPMLPPDFGSDDDETGAAESRDDDKKSSRAGAVP